MENMFSAGTGGAPNDTGRGINKESQDRLRQDEGGKTHDTSGTHLATKEVGNLLKDVASHAANYVKSATRQATKEPPVNIPLPVQGSLPKVAPSSKTPPDWLTKSMAPGSTDESKNTNLGQSQPREAGVLIDDVDSDLFGTYGNQQDQVSAGAQVRQAAVAASKTPDAGGGTDTRSARGNAPGLGPSPTNGPVPVTLAPGSGLSVNITSSCPHCGKDSHQSVHAQTQNAATGATGR
jgi:hypothetical protein